MVCSCMLFRCSMIDEARTVFPQPWVPDMHKNRSEIDVDDGSFHFRKAGLFLIQSQVPGNLDWTWCWWKSLTFGGSSQRWHRNLCASGLSISQSKDYYWIYANTLTGFGSAQQLGCHGCEIDNLRSSFETIKDISELLFKRTYEEPCRPGWRVSISK